MAVAAAAVAMIAAGCGDRDAVRVRLQAHPPAGADAQVIDLRAQVAGPLGGLRYRWFSVSGTNNPQESEDPASRFTFADGVPRDRVSVEVWRAGRRVARDEIDVRMEVARVRSAAGAQVVITTVPPFGPGGPDTRDTIAGRVTGAVDSTHRVILYARASDIWYVQPQPAARHTIGSDGRWKSWTHTGTSYAALVVRPGFVPLPLYDVLPQVGGHVIGRAVVEGLRP